MEFAFRHFLNAAHEDKLLWIGLSHALVQRQLLGVVVYHLTSAHGDKFARILFQQHFVHLVERMDFPIDELFKVFISR